MPTAVKGSEVLRERVIMVKWRRKLREDTQKKRSSEGLRESTCLKIPRTKRCRMGERRCFLKALTGGEIVGYIQPYSLKLEKGGRSAHLKKQKKVEEGRRKIAASIYSKEGILRAI